MKLDHALRLLPQDLGRIVRRKARGSFVFYDDVCFDLVPERLNRVFAASGRVDGREAGEFVVETLYPSDVARLFPNQAREIAARVQEDWAYEPWREVA